MVQSTIRRHDLNQEALNLSAIGGCPDHSRPYSHSMVPGGLEVTS